MRIDVYRKGESWFFRIIARNGRIVSDTAHDPNGGYRRKKAAVEIASKIAGETLLLSIED